MNVIKNGEFELDQYAFVVQRFKPLHHEDTPHKKQLTINTNNLYTVISFYLLWIYSRNLLLFIFNSAHSI